MFENRLRTYTCQYTAVHLRMYVCMYDTHLGIEDEAFEFIGNLNIEEQDETTAEQDQ